MSCPVVCMCLCFASCWRLCKSWAGASSQLGGQTRKQMDLFGLNPSHATSSHWPSSSNLHVSLQSRRKGEEWECMLFGGWEVVVKILIQSREADRNQRERLCLCRPFFTDLVCPKLCWHMALASMLELLVCSPCLSSAVFPLWYSLLSALSARPALCLFVPEMSCLFWDIESPHPVKSTGCLLTILAT